MHTFIAALSFRRPASQLSALIARTEEHSLPLLRSESSPISVLNSSVSGVPDRENPIRVAFQGFIPDASQQELLTVAQHPKALTIVFGDIGSTRGAAQQVLNAFLMGGIEQVRSLDGSFGALVVDHERAAVWMLSDLLGWRSLRFVQKNDLLLVSPHDVILAASGEVPLDFDLDALASIVIADHSLGGRSLLKAVRPCESAFAQLWRGAAVERAGSFGLELSKRIDPKDAAKVRAQRESVVDALASATRSFTRRQPQVAVELTAGLDSRAVFALLTGAAPEARLTAVTSGQESNLEVQVAQLLSSMRHIEHKVSSNISLNTDSASEHIRQRALACNGDTNAKRSLNRPPSYQKEARASGVCGELYRGFYYPYFGLLGAIPDDPERVLKTLMRFRFRRLPGLSFADDQQSSRFADRFRETLFDLAVHAESGADLTDLFYLFERCGRWGAKSVRFGRKPLFIPYASTTALRAAYQLPSPVGQHCAVQVQVLRRFFQESLAVPINGGSYPGLEGTGRSRYVARQLLTIKGKIVGQWRAKSAKIRHSSDLSQARSMPSLQASALAGPLFQYTHETLTQSAAMSPQLFGNVHLSKLLETHQRHESKLQVLGFLLTAEAFAQLCREAKHGK